jgi:outer membrane receptor protein involved in Fe transport
MKRSLDFVGKKRGDKSTAGHRSTAELVATILSCAAFTAAVGGRMEAAETTVLPEKEGAEAPKGTNVATMETVVVIGHLDEAREQIVPSLGATSYSISRDQIETMAQGGNAQFSQVLLRAPGVVGDSAVNGGLHVRGEHANLQYRINDVLLPEGISGFGLELSPRIVDSAQLITGTLPAQYGFRTAGVVDIHTKSGGMENGGEVGIYGGSFETFHPTFELGGSEGKWNYLIDGGYNQNALGIENHTGASSAIHDLTGQYKAFTYLSYVIDSSSRVSVLGSLSYSDYQVPNTPGLPAGMANTLPWHSFLGTTHFDSALLDENQNEQNYYGVVAYQKSLDKLNFQVATFGRASTVHFRPDPLGDLFFNGVASDVDKSLYSAGLEFDASYEATDQHTIRSGWMLVDEYVSNNLRTTVFPIDPVTGNPNGPAFPILDNPVLRGLFAGAYLQDEWRISPRLTFNVGGRFDVFSSSSDRENQLSPRANLTYKATESTAFHLGYARYFTPAPVESVSAGSVARFDNTSNASAVHDDSPVRAERANYYGAGVTQRLAPGLQLGIDGYYKTARNQLDDGLFGQTLILSAFNYHRADIHGLESTLSYTHKGFASYANLAVSRASGQEWASSQFLFDPADAAYARNHWVPLDHDQLVSGSFGTSYQWEQSSGNARIFADAIYGSGLRTDATAADGSNIPNGGTLPSYYSVNLGIERTIRIAKKQTLRARAEVVNVTDHVYELRNGAGVGVSAPQYGMRRGFFGSISYAF